MGAAKTRGIAASKNSTASHFYTTTKTSQNMQAGRTGTWRFDLAYPWDNGQSFYVYICDEVLIRFVSTGNLNFRWDGLANGFNENYALGHNLWTDQRRIQVRMDVVDVVDHSELNFYTRDPSVHDLDLLDDTNWTLEDTVVKPGFFTSVAGNTTAFMPGYSISDYFRGFMYEAYGLIDGNATPHHFDGEKMYDFMGYSGDFDSTNWNTPAPANDEEDYMPIVEDFPYLGDAPFWGTSGGAASIAGNNFGYFKAAERFDQQSRTDAIQLLVFTTGQGDGPPSEHFDTTGWTAVGDGDEYSDPGDYGTSETGIGGPNDERLSVYWRAVPSGFDSAVDTIAVSDVGDHLTFGVILLQGVDPTNPIASVAFARHNLDGNVGLPELTGLPTNAGVLYLVVAGTQVSEPTWANPALDDPGVHRYEILDLSNSGAANSFGHDGSLWTGFGGARAGGSSGDSGGATFAGAANYLSLAVGINPLGAGGGGNAAGLNREMTTDAILRRLKAVGATSQEVVGALNELNGTEGIGRQEALETYIDG